MKRTRLAALGWFVPILLGSCCTTVAPAQSVAATGGGAGAAVAVAETWIGRALFLRGFPAGSSLRYDTTGRLLNGDKTTDWTLAGMDVQTVTRKDAQTIELSGVRAAIRYNPENRLFERHPQKDEKISVVVATVSVAAAATRNNGASALPAADPLEEALGAIFAVGIDPALQRSMPAFWRHYFDPGVAWPPDGFAEIYVAQGAPTGLGQHAVPAAELTYPLVLHRVDPESSPEAGHDRVKGSVGLRVVVESTGTARRVTIVRPLGYGLDARSAAAMETWRFEPGRYRGEPVAMTIDVSEEFVTAPPRP